jgi:ribonuclease J
MVTLTVHRATNEIGGNCIEIAHDGQRILLDVGRPLDAPRGTTGFLAQTLDRTIPVAGVLISHAHQDHYGLLDETPEDWPVHCGGPTEALMRLTAALGGVTFRHQFQTWQSDKPFQLGPFSIRPRLTDHSAFDAYMLEVEVAGRRIFYSGDFRRHGRKGKLVDALIAHPPAQPDVLLMEGTNLGGNKPHVTEAQLENRFVDLFHEAAGRVFVAWSAQNIDRTVTLFRARRKAGRTLAIDLYTAFVLETLSIQGTIPQPHWPDIRVVFTKRLADMYRRNGAGAFVDRMVRPNGISAKALLVDPEKWVVMLRTSLVQPYEKLACIPRRMTVGPGPCGAAILRKKMANASLLGSLKAGQKHNIFTQAVMPPRRTC